jgi:hypothetical protein
MGLRTGWFPVTSVFCTATALWAIGSPRVDEPGYIGIAACPHLFGVYVYDIMNTIQSLFELYSYIFLVLAPLMRP